MVCPEARFRSGRQQDSGHEARRICKRPVRGSYPRFLERLAVILRRICREIAGEAA